MDFQRLERIYEEQFIDREWWGNFQLSASPVKKTFGKVTLPDLTAICAKIALHITGEIPRIVLSNKAPNLSLDSSKIALNIKLLHFDLPEEIKINALFGCFIHELGHLVYTRPDVEKAGGKRYTRLEAGILHMLEDRRVESALVKDYPGYYPFLYTARRLVLAVGWQAMEQHIGFYGGTDTEYRDVNGTDGTEALCDYICSKILYPNILEDPVYLKEIKSFPGNIRKMEAIDKLVDPLREYASLTYAEVETVADDLTRIVGDPGIFYENFCLQEMKNTMRGLENYEADREIRLAESVIADMQKTFNPGTFHFYAKTSPLATNSREQVTEKKFVHLVREVKAKVSPVPAELLTKARELSSGIQLQLSMFSAKTDRNKVIYEQDTGELDEEELYQSRFNRNIFWEEAEAFSARLEVVMLLDLSGSMVTGDKMAHQAVLVMALILAFERYANIVSYAVYGHRCDDDGIEITCFHEPGERLRLGKLFSQQALHANADGYAMQYCFGKFHAGSKCKLFLMISDGAPSVVGTEGEDAREQVRRVVHEARKKGIEVLSLGIDNFEQAEMYEEFIPYSGADTMLRFSRWLKKKFISLADETTF